MSHSRDSILRDNILAGYTITEVSCNECKSKLNVPSSDLLLLWIAIRNHENTATHKLAITEIKNETTESKVLSSQLTSPLEQDSGSLGKKNTHTDYMNIVSRDLIAPAIESKQSLVSNGTADILNLDKAFKDFLENDSDSDYPPADFTVHGKISETNIVHSTKNSIQLNDNKSDRMLTPKEAEESKSAARLHCEVCLVIYPSSHVESHEKGKKHLRLLNQRPKVDDVPRLPLFLQPKSSRTSENSLWCDACSIWLPASDPESLSLHNEGRKHKSMTNMKKDSPSKRDEFIKCILCNVSVPKLYLKSHMYSKRHQVLLEEKEAESIITENESLQSIPEWCNFCKIMIPSNNKVEHNKDRTHRSVKKKLCSMKKWHVFEYHEKHLGVQEDSFICVICSAFQGNTRVKERNTESHCAKKLHLSLIEAKIIPRSESMKGEPYWACVLCCNFHPMTTTLTDHLESVTHGDMLQKWQRSISESYRLMSSVQEPDESEEHSVRNKKQEETCGTVTNAEKERILNKDVENIEITEELIFGTGSIADEDVGNVTPLSKVSETHVVTPPFDATTSAERWFCSFCFTISIGEEARSKHFDSSSHRSKVETCEKIAQPVIKEKTPTTSTSQVTRSEMNRSKVETCEKIAQPVIKEKTPTTSTSHVTHSEMNRSKVETCEKIAQPVIKEKTPTTSTSQVKRSETNGTSVDRVHMARHPTEPLISGDVWYCLICSITSTDKMALISHSNTSLHIKKLLAFTNLNHLRDDGIPLSQRTSLMRKLIREAEGITHHVKLWPKLVVTDTNSIFCEICNKTVASPYDAVIHALWENHQQRVTVLRSDWLDSQWLTETSKNRFRCELCECEVPDYRRQLEDACKHASDGIHCKLLDMSYSEAVAKVLDRMKVSEGEHFDPDHLADCGDLLYCNVCDDFLNTPRDAFKHVQTETHLQIVATGSS